MDQRNFMYMFYGFAAAWAILVIYVLVLVASERRLHREMGRLRSMIGDRK